jgi:hypothetical protein
MSVQRVGGDYHEREHRARHATLYAPLFQFAFGDVATWGDKKACVLFAGEGREAAILAPFVREIWMLDDTEECLNAMQRRFESEHRAAVLPISEIGQIESGSIDIVTGLVALMHMGTTAIRNGHAEQIKRILSPTGRALVQVMCGTEYVDGPDHGYGAYDVGFRDDHEVVAYWQQYLPVRWVLRTPPIPFGRSEPCWWWVCMGEDPPLWMK